MTDPGDSCHPKRYTACRFSLILHYSPSVLSSCNITIIVSQISGFWSLILERERPAIVICPSPARTDAPYVTERGRDIRFTPIPVLFLLLPDYWLEIAARGQSMDLIVAGKPMHTDQIVIREGAGAHAALESTSGLPAGKRYKRRGYGIRGRAEDSPFACCSRADRSE